MSETETDSDDSGTPGSDGGGPTCKRTGVSRAGDTTVRRTHVDVPPAPREIRPHFSNYSPLEYVHTVLCRACGFTFGRPLDFYLEWHLLSRGCSSIPQVRREMLAVDARHRDLAIAPAYAHAIGIPVPEYDEGDVRTLLNGMDHALTAFYTMRDEGRLPVKRTNEPHTGMTLRRVAHACGLHGFEPAFRDLRSCAKRTERLIDAIFHELGWPRAEPCDDTCERR